MAKWETDWERQKRKALEEARETEFKKMLKTTLWAIGIVAAAFWAFLELQHHHFQIIIKDGKDEPAHAQQNATPMIDGQAASPQVPDKDISEYSPPPRNYDSQPAQVRPAAPKRSVQEEYEMASRIMESTASESQRARQSGQLIQNRYGSFPDQLSFNYWWLDRYENECLSQRPGTIDYRYCRATWKQQWLDECRDRTLRFEGLPSAQRDIERPIKEAQCYAANNYQVVE